MLSDENKLSLELYKELGLEVRQLGSETYATNRLMLPPLVIGLLMLYGAVEKFLGGQVVISRDALYLIWFGCALISLMWICKMSRLAQLSHWHLETQRRCEYKLEVIGHRNIAHKDEKSLISKILRHSALRFIGFGVYFALLLNFLLKPIFSYNALIPRGAIIVSGILSISIWYFYFKKPFRASTKTPAKLESIVSIIIFLGIVVLPILGIAIWVVLEIFLTGGLILFWYLYFKEYPPSKTPIKWYHIAIIIILAILIVEIPMLFLSCQQARFDANTYFINGLEYFAKGNYEFAIKDFSIAVALDPNNPGAYFNRGSAYYKKREFANAIVDFDKAIALDPQNWYARDLRNKAQRELENLAKQLEGRLFLPPVPNP